MISASECAAIIPCLNEARFITPLVVKVLELLPRVYVVDDGSTDGTAECAQVGGAKVLRNARPRGKGHSLALGIEQALQDGFRWAVLMDGDGQHDPEDIPAFLKVSPEEALVVGNRMEQVRPMPVLRQWVNRWMSSRLSALCGSTIPDSQCGFRRVDLRVWATLPIQAEHFEIESEMLVRFILRGHPVQFIPVRTVYRGESSKIRPGLDTIRWFVWFWRTRQMLAQDAGRGGEARFGKTALVHETGR